MQTIDEDVKEYIDIFSSVLESIAGDKYTIIGNLAKIYSKFYEELRENGFNHDDAIKICAGARIK